MPLGFAGNPHSRWPLAIIALMLAAACSPQNTVTSSSPTPRPGAFHIVDGIHVWTDSVPTSKYAVIVSERELPPESQPGVQIDYSIETGRRRAAQYAREHGASAVLIRTGWRELSQIRVDPPRIPVYNVTAISYTNDGTAATALKSAPVYVGEKSVASIFPGAKPGQLSPDAALRVWHDSRRDVFLGIDPRSGWGDAEASSIWSAIDSIEARFPAIYRELFVASRNGTASFLPHSDGNPWTNKNRTNAFIVVSDDFIEAGKTSMASNLYSLGQGVNNVYANVPFVGLIPRVIDGRVSGYGPGPTYPRFSASEARAAYLREGLFDSILHERLHTYIGQFYNHDRLYRALRPASPQPDCEYDLEELLVKDFLLKLYKQENVSLSREFLDYWTADTEALRTKPSLSLCFQRLSNQGLLTKPILSVP